MKRFLIFKRGKKSAGSPVFMSTLHSKRPALSCGYRDGLFLGVMILHGSMKENLRGLV